MASKSDYKYVDAFNSSLKKLAKFTVAQSIKLKIVSLFVGLDKRLNLVINESPLTTLELVGPRLIKYAEHIKRRDVEFFLNADFAEDMSEADPADKRSINEMIKAIKDIYKGCSVDDRNQIDDLVDDLLINYCGFLRSTDA